jgi:hypothetical protein
MPRMIDLVRASAVPANLMQAAARGALSVPPDEMMEILVHLTENRVFSQQARMTLAGWDENTSVRVAANPKTPLSVLEYLISPENLRPTVLPALLENPSVPEARLCQLAAGSTRETILAMMASARVQRSETVLKAVLASHHLTELETARVKQWLEALAALPTASLPGPGTEEPDPTPAADGASGQPGDTPATEEERSVIAAFERDHAAEIAAEADKPFHPIGGMPEEFDAGPALNPTPAAAAHAGAAAAAAPAPAPAPVAHTAAHPGYDPTQRGSMLQRIARLDVKGRIHLAVRGDKEARSILIRDGTKLVALAVLESPKITDGEVEKFASQKNVLEAVLRAIPLKRRFAKNYAIMRNLVFNPRTPLDISLGLMKNLLVHDLRNLSGNKEVSETIRKLALKMFKEKTDPTKKKE